MRVMFEKMDKSKIAFLRKSMAADTPRFGSAQLSSPATVKNSFFSSEGSLLPPKLSIPATSRHSQSSSQKSPRLLPEFSCNSTK